MINSPEYSGPYRWDEAKERIPNDYGEPTKSRAPERSSEDVGASELQTIEEWNMMKEDEITNDSLF